LIIRSKRDQLNKNKIKERASIFTSHLNSLWNSLSVKIGKLLPTIILTKLSKRRSAEKPYRKNWRPRKERI
jgi:hypothetical protein